jgi:predicted nucleic acid-binding protein
MKSFVVDTSALVRLYVPDGPLPDRLELAIDLAWRGEAMLLAPELALAEAAQVLCKKERGGFLSSEESDAIRGEMVDLPIDYCGHRDLIDAAVAITRARELTVYDALFVALAEAHRAELLTADRRLAVGPGKPARSRSSRRA